jgi:hypothetical protein
MVNNWNLIRVVHSYTTKIPPHVVDLLAVQEILRLYATGIGSVGIAETLETDREYVEDTLSTYYSFPVRKETLTYNPVRYYRESFKDLDTFLINCFLLDTESELVDAYLICKFYEMYEKELEKYEGS